jgi:hypothetical protein
VDTVIFDRRDCDRKHAKKQRSEFGEANDDEQSAGVIKADYMAEAVRLDWTKVQRIESKSTFLILLVDGKLITDVMR